MTAIGYTVVRSNVGYLNITCIILQTLWNEVVSIKTESKGVSIRELLMVIVFIKSQKC